MYMSSRELEPQPRWKHAAFGAGLNHFVWGGDGGSAKIQAQQIETFDVSSAKWKKPQLLQGSLPGRMYGMAITTDGESVFSFGGWNGSAHVNTIYEINPRTLKCREILPETSNSPPGISRSGIVCFNGTLVVCGGYTDAGHIDDLYVFDLRNSECGNNKRYTYVW